MQRHGAELCNNNLYGTIYKLNIKFYAWGWTGMPLSKLIKYDPKWRPSKTWTGGSKKGKASGIGSRAV